MSTPLVCPYCNLPIDTDKDLFSLDQSGGIHDTERDCARARTRALSKKKESES